MIAVEIMLTATMLLAVSSGWQPMSLSRDGPKFPDKGLSRLGVRYKGPIKVYAVGEYSDGTYMLKMSYGVGASKMTGALADALKPRCSDADAISKFEECLTKGLPNGAPKGTKMEFATGGGSLGVSVNGKKVGEVRSKVLSKAFANIYSDRNAVCSMDPVGSDGGRDGQGRPHHADAGRLVGALVGYKLGGALG